jgi:hypothetical protein
VEKGNGHASACFCYLLYRSPDQARSGSAVSAKNGLEEEPLLQAQDVVGRHGPFVADERIHPIGWHMQLPGQFYYRNIQPQQLN